MIATIWWQLHVMRYFDFFFNAGQKETASSRRNRPASSVARKENSLNQYKIYIHCDVTRYNEATYIQARWDYNIETLGTILVVIKCINLETHQINVPSAWSNFGEQVYIVACKNRQVLQINISIVRWWSDRSVQNPRCKIRTDLIWKIVTKYSFQ